jgi:hypothetical protein
MTYQSSVGNREEPIDDRSEAGSRDYRLAEFFSGLASAADVLREAVEELKAQDGLTAAGEHSFDAAVSAIAALASSEMDYYEDEGANPESFADYYNTIGEVPPTGAREFAQFPTHDSH